MRHSTAEVRSGTLAARALRPSDVADVVAIDAALSGRTRRAYFERRLALAQADPERTLQLAVEEEGALAGFMLGRVLEGEFGRSEPELRLEAFGVRAARQRRGLGTALGAAFEAEARRRGVRAVRTSARWREHALLRFLDRSGYGLASAHVLDRALASDLDPDAEAAARDAFDLRTLSTADADGIARIDQRHTGRNRRGFLCRAIAEGLTDSAVRVSLAVRVDGAIGGFLMARVDYGDFGRAEPVAIIDTVGVDPLRARCGIGRALLAQLFMNLRALGVERVETVVAPGNLDLMGLFYRAGFGPSERLAFRKDL